MLDMSFRINLYAKEFIAEAGREHHSRERYTGSLGSGEAGHSLGRKCTTGRVGVSALAGTAAHD